MNQKSLTPDLFLPNKNKQMKNYITLNKTHASKHINSKSEILIDKTNENKLITINSEDSPLISNRKNSKSQSVACVKYNQNDNYDKQ